MVVIQVENSAGVIGRCDERCYDGIARKCRCCCGGVNHGVGLKKAVSNARNLYEAVIILNCPPSKDLPKVTRFRPVQGVFKFTR